MTRLMENSHLLSAENVRAETMLLAARIRPDPTAPMEMRRAAYD